MSDRKYRQRGYQDADRRERERSRATAPQRPGDGPRGRGLGGPGRATFRCRGCGTECSVRGGVAPAATCDGCGAELHTCTHCRHFDTSAPNECRQPGIERVARKAAANDCPAFEPKSVQLVGGGDDAPGDARSAFDDLFDL